MVGDTVEELGKLLGEEREAILRLDGVRVLDLARRKETLVGRLRDARGSFSPETALAFQALVPALRHNGILLAHARDVLRDAVAAARAERTATSPSLPPADGGARRKLSVRG